MAHLKPVTLATGTAYRIFFNLNNKQYTKYFPPGTKRKTVESLKEEIEDLIKLYKLDKIEKDYIPDLKKHIVVKTIGTPTTNRDYAHAPAGNVYGSLMSPKNLTSRLNKNTPFENFYWCNASSGYAGMAGTAYTGAKFYEDMTGDTVIAEEDRGLTDDDVIDALWKKHG